MIGTIVLVLVGVAVLGVSAWMWWWDNGNISDVEAKKSEDVEK